MSSRRTVKKQQLLVTLRGIDVENVLYHHYGDHTTNSTCVDVEDDNKGTYQRVPQKQNARKNKRSMIFTSHTKNQSRMYAVMIDVTQNGALPRITHRPCWWCRTSFTNTPIGCPIRYVTCKKGSLEEKRFNEYIKKINLTSDGTTDFFETEGIFCSLSCAKAHVIDELSKGKTKFKKSLTLLSLMRTRSGDNSNDPIAVAPSWKLINEWGGHLSIQEYRESFGRVEYVETVNARRPMLYSTSQYFQEKIIRV